jgi:hypothetical protein
MARLLGVYVFGSVARSERDRLSDLDLLAIVADHEGKVAEAEVLRHVPADLRDIEPSISWYGQRRLGEMFVNGELFAWHLHRETIALFEAEPVIALLGEPAPYREAAADVASFEAILSGISGQLRLSPENAIYELGLVYVCLRNIGMAASAAFGPVPNFSRYSPYTLQGFPVAPISRAEYELAMACRMAGQRGARPPARINASFVAEIHARLEPWVADLRRQLEYDYGHVDAAHEI